MRKATMLKAAKLTSCVLLSASLTCVTPVLSFATPADEAAAQAQAALAQLDALTTQLEQAENDHFEAYTAALLAQQKVSEAQGKIDAANERISELQDKLGGRARSMYRSGGSSILDLIFGSTSFEEFATNWSLMERLNQNDANMVAETKELREEIEKEKVVLEEQQKIAADREAEAARIVEEAATAQAQMQEIYQSLSAEAAFLYAQEQAARYNVEATYDEATGQIVYNYTSNYVAGSGGSIVDRAYSWLGKAEYVWGACSEGQFDCSGFVSYCLTGNYSRLGNTTTFMGWTQVTDPQPGDVCVSEGHTGIYVGDGKMVHSATEGVGVVESNVQSGMIFVRY